MSCFVVGFYCFSVFCCALLCVRSGFAIILMMMQELVALVSLSSCVSWLLCCLSSCVSWLLCCFSSRCHGFVDSLWVWYFLIILTYYIKRASYVFNFSCYSYQTFFPSLRSISVFKIFLVSICLRTMLFSTGLISICPKKVMKALLFTNPKLLIKVIDRFSYVSNLLQKDTFSIFIVGPK